MRKKIVFISNKFPPAIDGVADYTFLLGKELEKENEVYYLNSASLEIEKWNYIGLKKAYQQIKVIKPNLISLQYVPFSFHPKGLPFDLCFFWILLRLKGYFLQVTFHEVAIGFKYTSLRQSFGALAQRMIAWLICLFSHHVFTSVGLYYQMLKPFNKNTRQVFIGSNLPVISNQHKKDKTTICSFNNRINKPLLEALSKLAALNYRFKLIGIGKMSDSLRKELENTIELFKLQPFVELQKPADAAHLALELAQSDIYVQLEWVNEKREGGISLKSGALMAAMANQLPIISTFGKMTDLNLLNENSGVICIDYANPILDKLRNLIDDSEYRQRLGSNSRNFYLKNCTWDIIANHYHQLIHD